MSAGHGHIDPSNRKVAMVLAWIGAGLGVVGIAFCLVGFLAPTAVHVF